MSTLIDNRPARFIDQETAEKLAKQYDFRLVSTRIRRALYSATSTQTGATFQNYVLQAPEDCLLMGIGITSRLDCSGLVIPTNVALSSSCSLNFGPYSPQPWGGNFGQDVDVYAFGSAMLDREGLNIYEDLWETPLTIGIGTDFTFSFIISQQAGTTSSTFFTLYLDFLPIKRI